MRSRFLGLAAVMLLVTTLTGTDTATAKARSAKATLRTAFGNRIGTVRFQTIGRHTEVRVTLNSGGLDDVEVDVFHGFHIHANGDDSASPGNGSGCIADAAAPRSTWFASADGHYNPTNQTHGHHVGDMPSIYFNSDGSVETRFRLDQIEPGDVIGKAVVLHAGMDNFGNVPVGGSPTQYTANSTDASGLTSRTGNAGDRIACGVITP